MQLRYDMVQCYIVRPSHGAGAHEVLQLRRSPEQFMAGTWQIITGRMAAGETAWQAGLNSIKAATGLYPLEFYQLDKVSTFYVASTDTLWNCPNFCAIVGRGEKIMLSAEHDSYRWIARETALKTLIWPGERYALFEMCQEILDNGPAKAYLKIELPAPPAPGE
jgi:hypothetical protein